jgi:hypothetical protein
MQSYVRHSPGKISTNRCRQYTSELTCRSNSLTGVGFQIMNDVWLHYLKKNGNAGLSYPSVR